MKTTDFKNKLQDFENGYNMGAFYASDIFTYFQDEDLTENQKQILNNWINPENVPETEDIPAVKTQATEIEIFQLLENLQANKSDLIISTSQFKKHKQEIKDYLNISDSVYIRLLKQYKYVLIEGAKQDTKSDKAYLKDFQNTANLVFTSMQNDIKYSNKLREVTKRYDNILSFFADWLKEYNNGIILTKKTFYNIEQCIIVVKYVSDENLTYNKVYSLLSKCIDNFFAYRKASIKDKDFKLIKYSENMVVKVCKYGTIDEKSGRPKQGEEITDIKPYMLDNLIDWNSFVNQ